MDSLDKIIAYYNNSSDDDMYHNVTGQILKNVHKIKDATIYDLADLCYSSPSTISRLMKKLEFKSYTDFKSKMQYTMSNYRYLNRNTKTIELQEDSEVIAAYYDYLMENLASLREQVNYDQIRSITDHLHDADNALFYSYPEVQINILQKCMIMSGKRAEIFDTIESQDQSISQVGQNTVVFAVIPDVREMSPMRSILKRAKEQGAFLITLCSEIHNDYEKYSDIHIGFTGTKTSMDLYLFMILINLIKADYGRRYIDPLVEQLYD